MECLYGMNGCVGGWVWILDFYISVACFWMGWVYPEGDELVSGVFYSVGNGFLIGVLGVD